jgi:hypothetical protein
VEEDQYGDDTEEPRDVKSILIEKYEEYDDDGGIPHCRLTMSSLSSLIERFSVVDSPGCYGVTTADGIMRWRS